MLSTDFINSSQSNRQISNAELHERESKFIADYVAGEITWCKKKETILLEWGDMLADFIPTLAWISADIQNKLRATRQLTEGQIGYVYEVYAEHRPQYIEKSSSSSAGNPAWKFDYDEIASQALDFDDMESRSQAEIFEICTRRSKHIKGAKTKLTDEHSTMLEFCQRHNVKLPEMEHERADFPPEQFWGQSQLWKVWGELKVLFAGMSAYCGDIQDLVYKFKPTGDVDIAAAQKLSNFKVDSVYLMANTVRYMGRGLRESMIMQSDRKNSLLMQDWFIAGIEKYTSHGSHGAGTNNAVLTGQYFYKLKDGNVVEYPVEREMTKEQMGDRSAAKLLTQARNVIFGNACEQSLQEWSKNTNIEEFHQSPEEFYQKELQRLKKR